MWAIKVVQFKLKLHSSKSSYTPLLIKCFLYCRKTVLRVIRVTNSNTSRETTDTNTPVLPQNSTLFGVCTIINQMVFPPQNSPFVFASSGNI